MVQALGARVLDADGGRAAARRRRARGRGALDLSGLHPGLADVEVIVACDVDNPLLGARGAAAVYGPQKGATPATCAAGGGR